MPETQPPYADIEAIRRVIAQYGQLLDDRRYDEWGDLFTADAEFASVPGGRLSGHDGIASFRGRAAIIEAVSAAQREMTSVAPLIHFGGNPVIDVARDRAQARWDFLVMHLKPGGTEISHAGRYYADLVKRDGRWRFQRRVSVRPGHALPQDISSTPRFETTRP